MPLPKMRHRWAIIDLDGSISDCSARRQLAMSARAATDPTEKAALWDRFHAGCSNDPAHEAEVILVQLWIQAGGRALFLTGRTDNYRVQTQRWLKAKGLPPTPLIMREVGYHGTSVEFKRAKLDLIKEYFMAPGDVISFVLEDHDKLVAMWRSLGITCIQPRLSTS
jgi:hypothetical protein